MPRSGIEKENEQYVLLALSTAAKNQAGIKEIRIRVNGFLQGSGSRRRLSEDQVQAVLASLQAQHKVSKWTESPATWGINDKGRKSLE